jgi:hypothetical protein
VPPDPVPFDCWRKFIFSDNVQGVFVLIHDASVVKGYRQAAGKSRAAYKGDTYKW